MSEHIMSTEGNVGDGEAANRSEALRAAHEYATKMSTPLNRVPEELRPFLSETIAVQCIEAPAALVSTILKAIPREASLALKTGCRFLTVKDGPHGKTIAVLSTGFLQAFEEDITRQLLIRSDILTLSMENRQRQSILRSIIEDPPTSFETIGHIAHYNLKENHLPYRYFIGAVTCEKEPTIKTVITKTESVHSEYRTYKFELIGGVPEYIVRLTQDGIIYTLDYTRVYWNSRLSSEHMALATHISTLLRADDLILDGTGGIGPHSLLLAKRFGFTNVICNDLNPDSYKYLQKNVSINKVEHAVTCMNEDIVAVLRRLLPEGRIRAVIFSLPELSTEFLGTMCGYHNIFCFLECFTRVSGELSYYDLLMKCSAALFEDISYAPSSGLSAGVEKLQVIRNDANLINSLVKRYECFEVKEVRTVSTNKYMYRVTLKVAEYLSPHKAVKK